MWIKLFIYNVLCLFVLLWVAWVFAKFCLYVIFFRLRENTEELDGSVWKFKYGTFINKITSEIIFNAKVKLQNGLCMVKVKGHNYNFV